MGHAGERMASYCEGSVVHISSLPYFTVDHEKRAGMTSLRKIVKEFAKKGWRVAFVYPVDEPKNNYQEDGIEFYPIYFPLWFFHQRPSNSFLERQRSRLSRLSFMTVFPFKIWSIIRNLSPSLLYCHGSNAVVVGAFFRSILKIPLVARHYGIGYFGDILGETPYSLKILYQYIAIILALKVRADLYVITDDGTKSREMLTKFSLVNRGLVLRNGVEVPQFIASFQKDRLKENLGINSNTILITYVGRIGGLKRVDRILKVAIEAYRHKRHWLFMIIGDGDEKASLENKIKENHLGEMIQFVGAVSHEDIWPYLCASEVFLSLPDLSSISNTLLEALSVGIPVVCSNKGNGVEELVIDGITGYLVNDPDDPMEAFLKIDKSLLISRGRILETVKLDTWESRLEKEFKAIEGILK